MRGDDVVKKKEKKKEKKKSLARAGGAGVDGVAAISHQDKYNHFCCDGFSSAPPSAPKPPPPKLKLEELSGSINHSVSTVYPYCGPSLTHSLSHSLTEETEQKRPPTLHID